MGNNVSLIKVDLPEPDTPVIQVNKPTGIFKLTFFRLLPFAPKIVSIFSRSTGTRFSGIAIRRSPLKNLPVNELGLLTISSSVP